MGRFTATAPLHSDDVAHPVMRFCHIGALRTMAMAMGWGNHHGSLNDDGPLHHDRAVHHHHFLVRGHIDRALDDHHLSGWGSVTVVTDVDGAAGATSTA